MMFKTEHISGEKCFIRDIYKFNFKWKCSIRDIEETLIIEIAIFLCSTYNMVHILKLGDQR